MQRPGEKGREYVIDLQSLKRRHGGMSANQTLRHRRWTNAATNYNGQHPHNRADRLRVRTIIRQPGNDGTISSPGINIPPHPHCASSISKRANGLHHPGLGIIEAVAVLLKEPSNTPHFCASLNSPLRCSWVWISFAHGEWS
ncbi:hypothetical protein CBL_08467 [Carabus blaptoides fortunei]